MSLLKEKLEDLYEYSNKILKSDKELSDSAAEDMNFINNMSRHMLKKMNKENEVDFIEEDGHYWIEYKEVEMIGKYIGNGVFRTIYSGLINKSKCKVLSEIILKESVFNES